MFPCVAYIQLSIGWLVLCLSTLSLCTVPESAVFYGLSNNTDNTENIVIYGFIVLGEISLFLILLVLASVRASPWTQEHRNVG